MLSSYTCQVRASVSLRHKVGYLPYDAGFSFSYRRSLSPYNILLKMHELCQSPTQTYDLTPTLSSPPTPLTAAYDTMLVVYDDNCPILPPLIPRSFAISTNNEPSFIFNKQAFRPIPIRVRPILGSKMSNNSSDIIFDKQVLFRPIMFEPRLRPRCKNEPLEALC